MAPKINTIVSKEDQALLEETAELENKDPDELLQRIIRKGIRQERKRLDKKMEQAAIEAGDMEMCEECGADLDEEGSCLECEEEENKDDAGAEDKGEEDDEDDDEALEEIDEKK